MLCSNPLSLPIYLFYDCSDLQAFPSAPIYPQYKFYFLHHNFMNEVASLCGDLHLLMSVYRGRYCVSGCQMRSHHEILYVKHKHSADLQVVDESSHIFYSIVYDKSIKVFTLFVLFKINT